MIKDIFDVDDVSDVPQKVLPYKQHKSKYPDAPRWKDNPLAYWRWYHKNVRLKTAQGGTK